MQVKEFFTALARRQKVAAVRARRRHTVSAHSSCLLLSPCIWWMPPLFHVAKQLPVLLETLGQMALGGLVPPEPPTSNHSPGTRMRRSAPLRHSSPCSSSPAPPEAIQGFVSHSKENLTHTDCLGSRPPRAPAGCSRRALGTCSHREHPRLYESLAVGSLHKAQSCDALFLEQSAKQAA